MRNYKNILILFVLLFSVAQKTWATHLQAGQITLTRLDPIALSYRITLVVYRDKVNLFGSGPTAELDNQATIVIYNANDQIIQTLTAPLTSRIDLTNEVEQGTYIVNYTFSGAGAYNIAFSESYRNGCIINMSTPDATDLYVESQLVINSFLGVNNSSVLLASPVDYAGLGQKFIHNPGAYDPDGDSLAYSLVTPQSGLNTNVRNYRSPSNFLGAAEAGGAGSFSIDPITGTVTWDTPNTIGCFNIAIKVEEWRKNSSCRYVFMGYVIRDMQIIVRNSNNKRPSLSIPTDICVAANSNLIAGITASDPDFHCVSLTATGQPFDNSTNPKAFLTYSGGNYTGQCLASPASVTFNWNPSCNQIRKTPYQIVFKIKDDSPPAVGPSLVDIKVWNVTVVGPKPQNLQAATDDVNDVINLTWDSYSCASQADSLIVWRKEGCSTGNPSSCDVGAPDGQGYYVLAKLPSNAINFTDRTAKIGVVYSYRISATFPNVSGITSCSNEPELSLGGESYASDEACLALAIDVPLFTKVDVLETANNTGKVRVEFIQPFQFPLGKPNDPFGYKVYRAEGISPANRTSDYTEVFSLLNKNSNDTDIIGFTDDNLNTLDKQYHYRIAFYSEATDEASKIFKDSSDAASTVRSSVENASSCLRVLWKYDVPWGGNRGYNHDILRSENTPTTFVDVGDKFISTESSGIFDDATVLLQSIYYYYTTTRGWYYNDAISLRYPSLAVPLLNNSQISSGTPQDIIKPCPPILSIEAIDCNNFTQTEPYFNSIRWENDPSQSGATTCGNLGDGCEYEPNNIAFFNIYYKPTLQSSYTKIAEVAGDVFSFQHTGLFSLAGCYAVSATDKTGNEGDFSNEVCVDNCINFLLPNAFSPNGDGTNELFQPIERDGYTVRFIQVIDFEVYNRWGKRVFRSDKDIRIKWGGNIGDVINDAQAKPALPAGLYYYLAKVRFYRLDENEAEQSYRGWVQILK
ncbi:MAG: gliding motility-associated C-terminal domain-containing protein [Thermonemataceae bacterium]|nr:gliding motility-associated C-terminal domain-containing protein [Thermonemataceae bacterium]